MSVYNGFKYPEIPDYLPLRDLVTERPISPRISFRRLRHVNGQHGQVINVSVLVNTMIKRLPATSMMIYI